MTTLDNRIQRAASEQSGYALALLERLVNIQSGTSNKEGVDAVVSLMEEELAGLGFELKRHRRRDFGDHLVALRGTEGDGAVLLVGHTDTVYPPEEPFQPFSLQGEQCLGQGVIDMKGGLACMVAAFRALETAGAWGDGPVAVLLNSDEEVGSTDSGPLRDEMGREARCALVLECGGKAGEVVTARRGQRTIHLQVRGEARHAGSRHPKRSNAVHELAHQIVALEGLTDLSMGRTVNVGRVKGGIGPNTLAAHAEAWVDVRYLEEEEGAAVQAEIEAVAQRPRVDGCEVLLEVRDGRPAWSTGESTKRLLSVVLEAAAALGQSVGAERRWGVSDANDFADLGLAVIDGLGPLGGKDHTPEEYCWVASLEERSSLLAATLARLLLTQRGP